MTNVPTRNDRSAHGQPDIGQKHKIAYMHVPKTSGSSVNLALRTATNARNVNVGLDLSLFGEFRAFDDMSPEIRQQICTDPASLERDVDLVLGHKSRSTLQTAFPGFRIFTILREPRARLISQWCYWRSFSDDHLKIWGGWSEYIKLARQTLGSYLTDPRVAASTDNLVVRMLLWPDRLVPDHGFIAREMDEVVLDAARKALNTLDFVGLMEDSDLDERLSEFLGLPFKRERINETVQIRPELRPDFSSELSEHAFAALRARTRLDAVLWAEVLQSVTPGRDPRTVGEQVLLAVLLRYVGSGVAKISTPES